MTVGALRLSRTLRLLINAPHSFLFQDFLFQNVPHSELPYSNNYILQDFPYQKNPPSIYFQNSSSARLYSSNTSCYQEFPFWLYGTNLVKKITAILPIAEVASGRVCNQEDYPV